MADKERAEALWAYCISREKVLKRLLEKEYITQEDADEISDQLFEQLKENNVYEFKTSEACEKMIRLYLKPWKSTDGYISLTDIAREKDSESPSYVIQSWLRNKNTIEFLRIWERQYNPEFNENECDTLLEAMKTTSFTLTAKQWITKTGAIGLTSKQGKSGGTFVHPDIACDFQAWLYPEFRLSIIKYFRESHS